MSELSTPADVAARGAAAAETVAAPAGAAPDRTRTGVGRRGDGGRWRRWPWLVAVVVLAGGGLGLWRLRASVGKPIDETLIVSARRGDLAIDVIETGKLQPHEKVEVKSKVAGQVQRVFVEAGEKVVAGQPLLQLDSTDFRRDVAQQQASVARAAADVQSADNALDFARINLERKQKGLEGRGVAQIDVDVARSEVRGKTAAVATAQAVLAGARVALGAAEDRLRYTEIRSPMNGTVIERGIEPGEVVTPGVQATFEGKALLTVANLSTLEVKSDLNQIDIAKVKLGQAVSLTLDALPGRKYTARVTRIAPASTVPKGKDVDVFPIEAALLDPDDQIKPGMTADVRIHVEVRHGVLSLPIEALVKEAGKTSVNRVSTDDKGRKTSVKTAVEVGARNDREVEITAGLLDGQRVLIKPASSADNEYK